jgi:hypothetical protein
MFVEGYIWHLSRGSYFWHHHASFDESHAILNVFDGLSFNRRIRLAASAPVLKSGAFE